MFARLKEIFGLDLRSLALFRIGLALTILVDLADRLPDLTAFHGDLGVLPRYALLEKFINPNWVSVYLMNGTSVFQGILFLITAVFAVMMLLGYRTRFSTIVSFILLISLQERNYMVLYGGDVVLRVLMFWAMFLPLGARYAIDGMRTVTAKGALQRHFSAASIGLLLQFFLIYFMAVIHKTGPEWWTERTAVYYTLSIDQLSTAFGEWLLTFKSLLPMLTIGVLVWQLVGSLLLFFPFRFGPVRVLVIIGFALMQIGFGASMTLGFFPWVCIVGSFALLPAWFWEKVFSRLKTKKRLGLKIYYDGNCGFCEKAVLFLKTFFLIPETKIQPVQNSPEIFADMERHNSWVVVDSGGKKYFKFEAVQEVMRASPILRFFVVVTKIPPVPFVGEKIYEFVAGFRSRHCERPLHHRRLPDPTGAAICCNLLAGFFVVFVLLWNTAEFSWNPVPFPKSLDFLGRALYIEQQWNMFSPSPAKDDGWFVMPATLIDGGEIDLMTGAPVTFEKPKNVSDQYRNQRWYKYMTNIWGSANSEHRLYFGQYLCRQWNWYSGRSADKQVKSFHIIFMLEKTLPRYRTPAIEKNDLWDHHCIE